jgi:hypothetical protein
MADKTKGIYDVVTQSQVSQKVVDFGDTTFGDAQAAYVYNGAGWVPEPTPQDVTYLASAARTTTQTQGDQLNNGWRGMLVVLDMTVVGTGSVTLTIQGKDAASGKYYTLLAGAAVVTNVTNVYYLFPGGPVAANVSANMELPRTFRLLVTANNANTATYSVGYSLLS